jgi:hypothetical protein
VQGVQVAAGPEAALELLGLAARRADREHLAEDIGPAGHEIMNSSAMISCTISARWRSGNEGKVLGAFISIFGQMF